MPVTDDHATGAAAGRGDTLRAEARGDGPPLVLAHGFTQTGRVWGGMDDDLARDHRLTRVDLPGHRGSSSVTADLSTGAALLGSAGGAADYLGYSMGARFCLHLALSRPELVRRLVLVSGTAGIDDPDERAARRRSDGALADRLDPRDGTVPADTVESFVERWISDPLFGAVPEARNGLAERMRNTAPGLASSLRLAGTGTQEPLWDRLAQLGMPVLVVTGSRDEKFTALGRRLVRSVGPGATHVIVADADHAPHLQHPAAVAAAVRSFLDGSGAS
jgi:2-succinyl-6-hydroxy-2,4-cyclohexadiene-1-carboxylate synthase